MRRHLRGCWRSVDRGAHRPAIEPRKLEDFGCRRGRFHGRQHGRTRQRERPPDPTWSKTLACADALCTGTGRSRVWPADGHRRSASGRREVVAGDARAREVSPRRSSWEADEQSGAIRGGAGGAKDGDQWKRGPTKHAPSAGSGKRVTGTGTRTASSKAKEEGEVHSAPAPCRPRHVENGVLRAQA